MKPGRFTTNPESISDMGLWNRDRTPTDEFNAATCITNPLPDVHSDELNPAW